MNVHQRRIIVCVRAREFACSHAHTHDAHTNIHAHPGRRNNNRGNRIGNANFGNGHIPALFRGRKRTKERWLARRTQKLHSQTRAHISACDFNQMWSIVIVCVIYTQTRAIILLYCDRLRWWERTLFRTSAARLFARRGHRVNNSLAKIKLFR